VAELVVLRLEGEIGGIDHFARQRETFHRHYARIYQRNSDACAGVARAPVLVELSPI
jgi:hypothetical protein